MSETLESSDSRGNEFQNAKPQQILFNRLLRTDVASEAGSAHRKTKQEPRGTLKTNKRHSSTNVYDSQPTVSHTWHQAAGIQHWITVTEMPLGK